MSRKMQGFRAIAWEMSGRGKASNDKEKCPKNKVVSGHCMHMQNTQQRHARTAQGTCEPYIKKGKEAGLGRERKLGLKKVGDTQLKPKSWAGAGDCRGTGTWTKEGKEAGLGRERRPGLNRERKLD